MNTTTNANVSLPLPPGNFGLPVIGETISFLRDRDFADKRFKKYGPVFKTHLFGRPTVVLIGADANRLLFTNNNQAFEISWPYSTKVLLGPASLSVQTGGTHVQRRKLLSQAFQPRALAGYIKTIEEFTHTYLKNWENLGKLTWYPELRKFTFDVACKLLIGTDFASQTRICDWFEEYCNGLFTIPLSLPWTKFGKALQSREKLLAEIEQIILQRQQQLNNNEDALGILLQAKDDEGNGLSLEELKDQILLLLFAGHETLTSALASLCLLLAKHPEVKTAVRAEQQQLGLEKPLTMEHLKQMVYLEQVLKEVLRFTPPVGGGFREIVKPLEFNGYYIPQGWTALYQVGKTHADEAIYTQPENFDPDRFALNRTEDKSKSFSYIPFGGGVRECIGKEFARLEMKIFAALLVRNYDWELLPQDLTLEMVPTPHPRDGLQVEFKQISQ